MQFQRTKTRFTPNLDITPLIDVVFLLLVFLLVTMTFAQNKTDVQEAIIDIELAESSTNPDNKPVTSITLLIDETGAMYQADSPTKRTPDEIRLFLSEQLLAHPDLAINVRADRRASHGDVIKALDLVKSLNISRVQLVIEKTPD